MADTTTARRQASRRAKLDAAARASGWHSWAEYERHIINGAATMTAKQAAEKLPALTVAERAADAYALRPCDYKHTDRENSKAEFARDLCENAGMTPTRGLVAEIVKLIDAE